MQSIPEISKQIVSSLTHTDEDYSRTIFVVGSKSVGKSTLLNSFLDKNETPKETLVLEYSFGRKSNQKQAIEKTICHVWEYGGKLDTLKTVLPCIPFVRGKYYYCVMVDLSKLKNIWNTLETCIKALNETYGNTEHMPELIIICGKYDLFKNYDSEIKKFICTTLRSVALLQNAHLLFYSSKEPQLVKRLRDLFHSIGFGNGAVVKEKNVSSAKPLCIPKGSDSWESIGVEGADWDQIKARHLSRFPLDLEISTEAIVSHPQRSHPEPTIDSLAALKYEELRHLESLDFSIDDYLRVH